MHALTYLVFGLVYLGMFLGRLPRLALDRTGIALLGAIMLIVSGVLTPQAAWLTIDLPTLGLLFGLMVVSAQFRLGGFYSHFTLRLSALRVPAPGLLALVVVSAGVLSAFLSNDIICLVMAPVLIAGCLGRQLNPVPFLLALACAANIGSAATLIGNPQNMLIGQVMQLDFAAYSLQALVPVLAGLVVTWAVVTRLYRGRWEMRREPPQLQIQPFSPWQTGKAFAVLSVIVAAFLLGSWPREIVALAAAGVLLTSRSMHSRDMLQLVDWQLLVLFAGLFVVNHALLQTGAPAALVGDLRGLGVDITQPGWLMVAIIGLSNAVSNVPAVMLLLPFADDALGGTVLAVFSTLAGNLLIVGSIANIIVVDQASRHGITISWREHARVGIPVTLLSLTVAALWLKNGAGYSF
jgi:Na+/H+ antiporter NhaD/arsenite permease-like protein